MVRARLHLICGNCGNSEGFKHEIKKDEELGHLSVSIKCPDCATIHWLDEYSDYQNDEQSDIIKERKNTLRQCRKFVNMSNRWTREQILKEREELLPKLKEQSDE